MDWRKLAPMKIGRAHHVSFGLNGYLYVAGGKGKHSNKLLSDSESFGAIPTFGAHAFRSRAIFNNTFQYTLTAHIVLAPKLCGPYNRIAPKICAYNSDCLRIFCPQS